MEESAQNRNLAKKIDAYVKGNLSEDQADALWAELLEQPEYINYLKTEIATARIYQSRVEHLESIKNDENQQETKSVSREKNRWWWYSAAAAVILAVVLTSVFVINYRSNIYQWSNQKIALGKNLASAPVTRAAKQIPPPDSLLNAGFNAAINGNITEAMEIFHLVVKKYNNTKIAAKANLNIGILQYNSLKYKSSIPYFKRAVAHAGSLTLLKERAYWYMGNAYINTGQLVNAREAISHARSIGKVYKKEESKLLRRLNRSLKNRDKAGAGQS